MIDKEMRMRLTAKNIDHFLEKTNLHELLFKYYTTDGHTDTVSFNGRMKRIRLELERILLN